VLTVVNTLVPVIRPERRRRRLYNDLSAGLTVRHDDFYANHAGREGGGIYDGSGEAVINSTIIISNTATSGGGISASPTQLYYNDVTGNLPAAIMAEASPPDWRRPRLHFPRPGQRRLPADLRGSPVEDKADRPAR